MPMRVAGPVSRQFLEWNSWRGGQYMGL